jgi:hypothetical protein
VVSEEVHLSRAIDGRDLAAKSGVWGVVGRASTVTITLRRV